MGMWPAIRRAVFWVHLTIGLAAAVALGLMCVTGVLLTYERQTITLFDRWGLEARPPAPGAQRLSMEELVAKVRRQRGAAPETVTVFAAANLPVQLGLKGVRLSPYVDPYTGAEIGTPSRGIRTFFAAVIRWHTALGVNGAGGRLGNDVVRRINMLFLFLMLLGILLWIPRRWTWRQVRGGLFFRPGLPGHARDFNWHNVIGIWSAVPLLVIAWTAMAMPQSWARRITEQVVGTQSPEWHGAQASTTPALSLTLDELLARAERQAPGWKAVSMQIPEKESSAVDFAIDMSGYNGIGKSAALQLDRSGRVVVFHPAGSTRMLAQTFIRFGHTGEAWGIAGQTIAGLVSLGGAVLVWTGVALSLRRFYAARARGKARAAVTH